jgi:preprotein translocase subunit SecF
MVVGVIIGTYSSIFVASPVVYMLYQRFPPAVK